MRRFFLVTHRWLGIAATPVLIIVGLTGVPLVWFRIRPVTALHVNLGLGHFGAWVVNIATIIASLLVIGGIVLWWRRKVFSINRSKGWWRFLFDLHHLLGILGAGLMLVIALSGTGLMLTEDIGRRRGLEKTNPDYPTASEIRLRRWVHAAHTARPFAGTFGVFWVVCSAAFGIQAVSGLLMWWKPHKGNS